MASQTWLSVKYPLLSRFSRGNISLLADFAAYMIQQMWHQKTNLSTPNSMSRDFYKRVMARSEVSPSIILLGLKYIQRLTKYCPGMCGEVGSECRLFVVSLMVSHKMLEDSTYTNQTWSELTLIPVNELNQMEGEFLFSINYDLHIPEETFSQWLLYIEQYVHHQEVASFEAMNLPFLNFPKLVYCDITQHDQRPLSCMKLKCYP